MPNKKVTSQKSALSNSSSNKKSKENRPSAEPKKPLSGFMFFSTQFSKMIRDRNPDLKTTEISKIVGENWNKLSNEQKQPFENKANQDRLRYDKELKLMK